MLTKSAIEQGEYNPERYTCNIRNPVLYIRTASEGRLDYLYETSKSACPNEDWNQPNTACTCQRKGQSGEGDEVHDFIGPIRRLGRLIDWPKHGHCQYSRDNQCERDIEILAHVNGV